MTKPKKILITGARGNIASAVIEQFLENKKQTIEIIAAVRNVEQAKKQFPNWINKVEFRVFDFENEATYQAALVDIDCVFLLRPPAITNIETVFRPLIAAIIENEIKEIVFLSVQGVEKSRVIPHNKIEVEIKNANLDYIFIRPSYFMQNLTTELLSDIQNKQQIILPAGNAKFNWIDVNNIAEVIAKVIERFKTYKNQAIEVTGNENENFETVANLMRETLAIPIKYRNVNPFQFYWIKRKENIPFGKIMVMIVLHFLPRFEAAPKISDNYEKIIGKQPTTLVEFMERVQEKFIKK